MCWAESICPSQPAPLQPCIAPVQALECLLCPPHRVRPTQFKVAIVRLLYGVKIFRADFVCTLRGLLASPAVPSRFYLDVEGVGVRRPGNRVKTRVLRCGAADPAVTRRFAAQLTRCKRISKQVTGSLDVTVTVPPCAVAVWRTTYRPRPRLAPAVRGASS